MTDFSKLKKSNFVYFLKKVWPEHVHFNAGVKRVFEEDKAHENDRATYIKLLFLDKAYSAGLRRWVKRCAPDECPNPNRKGECRCDTVELVVDGLEVGKSTSEFRKAISQSSKIGKYLSRSNQEAVVNCHGTFSKAFLKQIREIDGTDEKPKFQSFTSKYLWFHAGVFPVFDRVARVGLKRLQERGTKQCETYEELVDQVISLMEKLYEKKSCSKFTPEQIKKADGYLIWIGARAANMKRGMSE